ncbi:MAG: iron-sulfur cluster assembly protein [Candidatus Promineifilaceae bacterium]|jgi:iron-sulfur cluster assembly protein
MSTETITAVNIDVTEKAKSKLLELGLDDERFLRLGVRPGGCAGMTYDAVIDDTMEDGDQVVYQSDALRVVSDQANVVYLDGLKIDFSDDLVQSGFVLSNPNVKKSCGCGASFGPGEGTAKSGGGCGSGGCG